MDFKSAALFGSCISKDYAEDLFRLLDTYKSISASEAASRLKLHIKTVQDFMEAMTTLNILKREEVFEKKRPYYRYSLKREKIVFDLVLTTPEKEMQIDSSLQKKIREKKDAPVRFTTSRSSDSISKVVIWEGTGRNQTERKINLSQAQGRFLYNLPFPNADYLSISLIMEKAGIESEYAPEILDIIDLLIDHKIVETEYQYL